MFRQAKEEAEDGRSGHSRRSSKAEDIAADGLGHGMHRRLSDTNSISSRVDATSPGEASPVLRRRSSGGAPRRSALTVAPLSTIPNVYFDSDFHLENPRTFDIVSERSEIARPLGANGAPVSPGASGKKALAANAILQEKISWYMDTVEIHLISSISTASTSFFAALSSLRELHAEAADSVTKIKTLRQDLSNLDQSMAVGGLKIVEKRRRRQNLRRLGDAIHQLEMVMEAVTECEEQIDNGRIEGALEGIANVERLMAGESDGSADRVNPPNTSFHRPRLINLYGIKALEGASNDLTFLRKRIGKAYEAKFLEVLLGDLRRHVDEVSATSTFQRWDKASSRLRGHHVRTPSEFPKFLNVEDEFRSTLRSNLKGLARSDSVMPAAMAYREAILREFKNLIRRHLPSSTDDDAESTTSIMTQESRALSSQEKSSILARNLQSLESEDAEDMFKKIYSNVGEALRRLGTQVKVLLDITSSLENPPPSFKSPPNTPQIGSTDSTTSRLSLGTLTGNVKQEEIQQALDLSALLGQAVDIAQAQVNKVLKVRTDQTTRLKMPFFLRYFTLNRLFADECEAISGRSGSALKSVVHEHIKTYVSLTAEAERQRLVQKMDADKWDAKDFTEEDSDRLGRILSASTKDVEPWTKLSSIWESSENGISTVSSNGISTNGAGDSTAKEKVRSAVIDEDKFILPDSALAAERGIEVFEKLLTGIPSMGTEISTALIDFLKLFNSRSSQLILGAGATRSAGLKNITTRHLALSSQALSFVIAIVPYIREFARRHLPQSSGLMTDFDKVKRLFQDHQSGIHDKLVDIMTGRATAHVSAMKKIDFDAASASDPPNAYMEILVKETATLHKVLARHLSEITVQMIMGPVMDNYREQWSKAFKGVTLKTSVGKERFVFLLLLF